MPAAARACGFQLPSACDADTGRERPPWRSWIAFVLPADARNRANGAPGLSGASGDGAAAEQERHGGRSLPGASTLRPPPSAPCPLPLRSPVRAILQFARHALQVGDFLLEVG